MTNLHLVGLPHMKLEELGLIVNEGKMMDAIFVEALNNVMPMIRTTK